MSSGVYCICNKENGKCYVGSSYRLEKRLQEHFKNLRNNVHGNKHMQAAFNLYGEAVFSTSVLKLCAPEDLLVWEQKYIDEMKPEYNKAKSAASVRGFHHTSETKALLAQQKIGKHLSEEHRAKIAAANSKRVWTDASRKKTADSHRSREHTPETKAKLKKAWLTRVIPADVRKKMATGIQKWWNRKKGKNESG